MMGRMPRFRHDSLYTRLFISFLVIILPIQVLGFVIYQQSKGALEAEIKNTAAANVSFMATNFDTRIEGIVNQLNLLVNAPDTTICKFYVENDTYSEGEYWLMLREIIAKLTLLKYSSDNYIEDILLYYPTMELMVSTLKGVQAMDADTYARDLAAFYAQGALLADNGTVRYVGKLYPSASYWQKGQGNSKVVVFLQAILSNSAVQDYLSTFSAYSEYPTAMVNYNADTTLYDAATENRHGRNGFILQIPPGTQEMGVTWVRQEDYYVVSAHSSYINCSFVQYLPIAALFRIPQQFSRYNLIFMLLTVPLLFGYSVILYRVVKHPVDTLVDAFRRVRGGNLDVQLQLTSPSREINDLIGGFNEMTAQLDTLIDKVYKQELYTRQIEFKQLQSQINPHFLYNSFFTLSHLIQEEDIASATRLANYLGGYFRYITKTGMPQIPLREEYIHAEAYLQIQRMRFSNRLRAEWADLPPETADLLVPRLILQPILENTLEHGVTAKKEDWLVRLTFEEEAEALRIRIEDNGESLEDATLERLRRQLLGEEPVAETTGLINIHRRLQLAFGGLYGITVGRSPLGGLLVDMKLPLRGGMTHAILSGADR